MVPVLEQLVREVVDVTRAPEPQLLEDDSPALSVAALADDDSIYLVGLIGGKDVGKSALINALVGKPITAVTSTGAGTEIVVAYVHSSQTAPLRELLEREVPGDYRIETHELPYIRRQVLLDLPDIDSHYAAHLAVTRKMLRHMLYPVWVGSVEKYADQQPQAMLVKVAAGNPPDNFIFCLNKVDQIEKYAATSRQAGPVDDDSLPAASGTTDRHGSSTADLSLTNSTTTLVASATAEPRAQQKILTPIDKLRIDCAARLGRTLSLPQPPRVFMIAARFPLRFDLPSLRQMLSHERTPEAIAESKRLAAARQEEALLAWLEAQDIPRRAARLDAIKRDADDLLAARVATPLLERVVPRLLNDPSTRFAMADEILQERVARWPIISIIHTLLQPLYMLLRSVVSKGAAPMQGSGAMVDEIVMESGESVARRVQSTFAHLRQTQPAMAPLYEQNRLWEDMPADIAARNLRNALAETVERQRGAARRNLSGTGANALAPVRWLLTVGALLWFPFVQPILSALLGGTNPQSSFWHIHWSDFARLFVMVLGVDYLWKSVGFLVIYFAVLWLALRWNTQRKTERLMMRWRDAEFPDPSLNLATQTILWCENLVSPIAIARDTMQMLSDRVAAIRSKVV